MGKIILELLTSMLGVRVKGKEELLSAWGLEMYPQMAKKDQKIAKSHFCRTQALLIGDSAA